ncbi:putative glucoamylase [Edaphobacter aggregans]|uniref:Putative glucoamylase n=1 Tax=Edaphobacter aggregans TaxID=570835 RepID=A0A428MHX5_9BACT|nr:glucoamylase family protein [Edaphobacter aggregans]RSL16545.1 putative glucoamylase [Edaphobacter aggregans]
MALYSEGISFEHASPLTAPVPDFPAGGLAECPAVTEAELRIHADELVARWKPVAASAIGDNLIKRRTELRIRLAERLGVCRRIASPNQLTPQLELLESAKMFEFAIPSEEDVATRFRKLPWVRVESGDEMPQVIHLAMGYLAAAGGIWSAESLEMYVGEVQRHHPLLLQEVLLLPESLRLAQLQFILDRADEAFAAGELPPIEQSPFSAPIHSLRRLNQTEWSVLLEPLVAFNAILLQDPGNVVAAMEEETRGTYRTRVAELARHADASEVQTAQIALDLAREAGRVGDPDPRLALRKTHIGYYLFAEGLEQLEHLIGYHPPAIDRLRRLIRRSNEDFYILGTFTLSLLLITAVILPLVPHHDFWSVMGALLLALLPATQGAVDLVNGVVSALFKPEALPKLDFSKGVPDESSTFVVVPTLLLHEKQVRELVEQLEARYLSNQDPNIHFGLLTDLSDTPTRPEPEGNDPLVQLARRSIDELNAKYMGHCGGSFFLLHRHRVFNARQGVWMGWERKRGKLLDLNSFLLHGYDSFPVKAGPLDVLERVRYVLTLDSDTQLPRDTAVRLIGTIAHPLNRAIVSPRLRIVTAGYGILQPRVGVSVASVSRSRLAALYSGETGFDIYSRAVSDVYQDLFGEGIFTGKGIYEVGIFHEVLNHRFPRNALLSHDLIEGAYVRAGLVTDVEVIDDYPSHYSAHTRRKHRWLRGDWQITRWLFNTVPDESGRSVPNPINTISRWKILDNLRRSLIEPLTFLLFVFGWFFLPGGAVYWTIATLVVLLLPGMVQLGFNFVNAVLKLSITGIRDAFYTFASSFGITLLNLIFLPHHMLLSLDAIVRSLIRTLISGRHLLDWETSAQSESGASFSSLDLYLKLSPVIAFILALTLFRRHTHALLAAAPILALWALAPLAASWLNSSPKPMTGPLAAKEKAFLQHQALGIWRYFAEFGGSENHWLIPDNVEEKDTFQTRKLSPTNLGMLFNARQAAYELGFLTLAEFAEATLGTLTTYDSLEKHRGHIYNWYDIESLRPIAPFTISAVDSGNLAASLYTVHAGALDLLKRPLLHAQSFIALDQMLQRGHGKNAVDSSDASVMRAHVQVLLESPPTAPVARDSGEDWLMQESFRRHSALAQFVERYTPWLLPRFAPLFELPQFAGPEDGKIPVLQEALEYAANLARRLEGTAIPQNVASEDRSLAAELCSSLLIAQQNLSRLQADIAAIAAKAEQYADAMDYSFLLVPSRQLLSIGYDGSTGELHSACYDLLASEARMAFFLAVAKGDIPQQAWFRLDRSHVFVKGRAALISWTGTMFEYMMPALWMRVYPNSLVTRSLEAVVHVQRDHVRKIPWGISESGFAKTDAQGRYGYQAWGIPGLALKYGAEDGPVISPYSTYLAVALLRDEALANLRRMASMGWSGAYGLYEAADYTEGGEPRLVRSWMAHHQGMSLLALTNLLHDNIVQRWFHGNAIVRAAELLLHEKPLSKNTLRELRRQSKLQSVSLDDAEKPADAIA